MAHRRVHRKKEKNFPQQFICEDIKQAINDLLETPLKTPRFMN